MKTKILYLTLGLVGAVATAQADDLVAKGKEIVTAKKCSICHAVEGKGGKIGKPMNELAKDKTDAFLLEAMVDPKKAIGPDTKMPSYKGKLTDDEIKACVEYIKSLK